MKILSPQDLQQNYTQTPSGIWVVNNLLRTNRKRISLLCGSPHAGKSTLARQLAIAVAHGDTFLGRTTLKSKIAYWQSEETEEDAQEDFTKSGMTVADESYLRILHAEPEDNNLQCVNKLLQADPDIRLVIIETLDDFLQVDDLNKNNQVREAFEKFDKELVHGHTHRCIFLVLHHFKKSDEQRCTSMHSILGATVIAGKTDAKIFMRGCGDNDPRRVISANIRKGLSLEPTYLTFDEATQSSTLGTTVAEARTESKRAVVTMNAAELRQRCIEVVASNQGTTKTEACKEVGGHKKAALTMLDSLIKDGVIEVTIGGATGTANFLYTKGRAPTDTSSAARLQRARGELAQVEMTRGQMSTPNSDYWIKQTADAQAEVSRLEKEMTQ